MRYKGQGHRKKRAQNKEQRQREASIARGHQAAPCPRCGKRCWSSRKAARAAAKSLQSPGPAITTYKCGEFWHIGHTPHQVRRGYQARDEFAVIRPQDFQG